MLIDNDLNPRLIEINTNPALFTDTTVQKELLPKLVDDVVTMGLELHPMGKTEGTEEVKNFLDNGFKDLKLKYEIIYQEWDR